MGEVENSFEDRLLLQQSLLPSSVLSTELITDVVLLAPNDDPYANLNFVSKRLAFAGSGRLWQFLLELLSDKRNANIIRWISRQGEFEFVLPEEVAKLWGDRKSKPTMNYDKISRVLGYYCDKNIIIPAHGNRYVYQFNFQDILQPSQAKPTDGLIQRAPLVARDFFRSALGPHSAALARELFADMPHKSLCYSSLINSASLQLAYLFVIASSRI